MECPQKADAVIEAEVIELTELAERRQRLTEQGQQLRVRGQEIEQPRLDRMAELRLLEGVDAFCASIRDAMGRDRLSIISGRRAP